MTPTTRPTMDEFREIAHNIISYCREHRTNTDVLTYTHDEAIEYVVAAMSRLTLPAEEVAQHDEGHPHLINGEFQSDKYPTTPRGKVPLSVKDKTAQDLLWEYAQRRRTVDAEFAADLEISLRSHGFTKTTHAGEGMVEAFRKWWREECRFGMTETEAVASFTAALSPSKPAPVVDDPSDTVAADCEKQATILEKFILDGDEASELLRVQNALRCAAAVIRHKLCSSPQPDRGSERANEVAWLAEVLPGKSASYPPTYYKYGAHRKVEFTTDANAALRFARKQDAEVAIKSLNLIGCEAVEHAWCFTSPNRPQATEGE